LLPSVPDGIVFTMPMKLTTPPLVFTLFLLARVSLGAPAPGAEVPSQASRSAIYDEQAEGTKQITKALATAKRKQKRVLVQFGANWCVWCHRLHALFQSDAKIAAALKAGYVVVLVDVNKGRNADVDQRYDHPTQFGLPAIVILEASGKALVTLDTGQLEEGDHYNPEKVLAFLNQWSPKP
jgi:thiol:disulfide interchange protein